MSHELRTPLNAMIGFSEVMQQALFGPLGQAKYRNTPATSTRAAASARPDQRHPRHVEDRGRPHVSSTASSVDLADIVEDSMKVVSQAAAERNIALSRHGPQHLTLEADRRALKQVLLNLLSNAVKFTRDGGRVEVHCRVARLCQGRHQGYRHRHPRGRHRQARQALRAGREPVLQEPSGQRAWRCHLARPGRAAGDAPHHSREGQGTPSPARFR